MICEAEQLKARRKDNTVNLQDMSVSGSGNNTFLKIYWAGNHQKGSISGPGNLQKAREILYQMFPNFTVYSISTATLTYCIEYLKN